MVNIFRIAFKRTFLCALVLVLCKFIEHEHFTVRLVKM